MKKNEHPEAAVIGVIDNDSIRRLDASLYERYRHDPDANKIEPFFLAEITAVMNLVVFGYNLIGKPNDPVPQALGNVLGVLDAVQARINNVQSRISELLSSIEKLEISLKGYISEQLIVDAMSDAKARAGVLQALMRDEQTLRSDIPRAKSAVDDLYASMERVRGLTKGGFAAALAMAPGMTMWTQATMAINRVGGSTLTAWDFQFHTDNVNMFNDMFSKNSLLEAEYVTNIPLVPGQAVDFIYDETYPVKLRPQSVPTGQSPLNYYKLGELFGPPGGGRLPVPGDPLPQLSSKLLTYAPQDLMGHTIWLPLSIEGSPSSAPDPATASKVLAQTNVLRAYKQEIMAQRRIMKNANVCKQLFSEYCTAKPAEWGGSGPPVQTNPVIYLTNQTWDRANVEVRRGTDSNCSNNAAFETRALERSEYWIIPTPDVDVCYRRDLDPNHPNGQWTPWRRISFTGETSRVIQIT